MMTMLKHALGCLFLVGSAGCIGTETGNPVKPTLDATRIELIMHSDGYEVVGEAGAVTEDGQIASFEVWSTEEPLRSPVRPSTGFSFEFVGSVPPFRVFAENATGRSDMLVLGEELSLENLSCFRYLGEFDYEFGSIEATGDEVEVLSVSLLNTCQMPASLPSARLRLGEDGLRIVEPSGPTEAGARASVTIIAGPTVTEFDDVLLLGDRAFGSISFRGRVER